ncbi:hypothetical protein EDD22DRAFT_847997, partial [Suillus occidentalis]
MTNPASNAHVFGLADIANVFEFAASRLLAIRISLDKSHVVRSSKARSIVTWYLGWEGDAFITPFVNYCMLGMSQLELLNYQEFYDSFMKLPASPTGAWVAGRI